VVADISNTTVYLIVAILVGVAAILYIVRR